MTANELRALLHDDVCEVIFEKKDGSERTMICTLMEHFLPIQSETVSSVEPNQKLITVWDLEANGWRSFNLASVKSIKTSEE